MSNQVYHLVVFLAALAALLAIILTGHDSSGSLTAIVTQLAAGVVGGSGAAALGNLIAPPSTTPVINVTPPAGSKS